MYQLKNILFLELTKNQKASLFSFLKSFTKKHNEKKVEDILDLFIEDENYYYEQNNAHFEWIIAEFEKDSFLDELKKYIKECKKELERKEAQKPFLEKQKAIMKEQRVKQRDYLMSKQPPTQKQLYYYDKLCEKRHITPENKEGLSRLDLRTMIGKLLDDTTAQETD